LCASFFNTTLFAQPANNDLQAAAAQLGIANKKPVYRAPVTQARPQHTPPRRQQRAVRKAPQTGLQRIRQARLADPYARRRLQIIKENAARRKAHLNRLTAQRQQKVQQRQRRQAQARYASNTRARKNNQYRAPRKQYRPQQTHNNVWGRIYQGFKIRDYNHQPLVKRFTREFSRNPARIQQLADRSSDFLYMVVNELNRRHMPTELALLPFVESAYRNAAYSHAGAAGMWQFIPATGRRFGLHRTRSYDARLDPIKATKAALSYLQTLNRQFRGDWLLSLAAYNCGEYRVAREIANNRRRGMRTDYWSLNLPRETKQYVPRLLAFKQIFRNPRAYGVRLRGIPNQVALTSIRINKAVNLRKAAATAGLPSDTLTILNSAFLHGITTPRISNEILLPRRHAGRLTQIIHRLPNARDVQHKYAYQPRKKRRYKKRYSKKRRYRYVKVRSGDNLYQIAKRHGISVKRLKRLNKLRSNKIWPGRRLKVAIRKGKRYS
jgi:membrane-bound lytic murein transglycosylase D